MALISSGDCVQFLTESLRHQILLYCLWQMVVRWKKFVFRSPSSVHLMQDFKAHNSSSSGSICWYSVIRSFSRLSRKVLLLLRSNF